MGLAVALTGPCCATAARAEPVWVSLGPAGGQNVRITSDASTSGRFYASTAGGLYRSDDRGDQWERMPGFIDRALYRVAIDPQTPTTLYVPAADGRVLKSIDGGATWSGNPLPNAAQGQVLAIDPTQPSRLYVTTGLGGGVFRSLDAGQTWALANSGLCSSCWPLDIALDPFVPLTLFAIGRDNGIYKSVDGADSWTLVSTADVQFLAPDPATPNVIYAGGGAGMLRSADGGATWTAINTGFSGSVLGIAVDPATPGTLYCGSTTGVYKSGNSGASWSKLGGGLPGGVDLSLSAIDRWNPGTLFVTAGALQALYRSTDGGSTWSTAHTGLTNTGMTAMAIDPATPTTLYAGLQRSTDAGETWAIDAPAVPAVGDRVFDPVDPNKSYLSALSNGVWRRNGSGWSQGGNTAGRYMNDVDVDRSTPSTIWAASDSGPLRSLNGGVSFTLQTSGLQYTYTYAVAVDPFSSANVLASTIGGQALYRSVDGGATWQRTEYRAGYTVGRLIFDPLTPGYAYAVTNYAVYRSSNGGVSWGGIVDGLPTVGTRELLIDPTNSAVLYCGAVDGLYKSTNRGTNWIRMGTEGLTSLYVRGIAIHPSQANVVYISTQNGGVFRLDQPCGNGAVDAGEQCDDGNTRDGDCCSSTCQLAAAGATCRVAAGVCDAPEQCDGSSGACPADAKSTAVCRAALDVCDTAELCDGGADQCPADARQPATVVCRAAAGGCDLEERCDGQGVQCPADLLAQPGVVCRGASGLCDAAETCTGSSSTCPHDDATLCTATPTLTATASVTPSHPATGTATMTATPSWTASPSVTVSATASPSATLAPTETAPPSATTTTTPSASATATAVAPATATASLTSTSTESASVTPTPTPSSTQTPAASSTATPGATTTPPPSVAATATSVPTASATPSATPPPPSHACPVVAASGCRSAARAKLLIRDASSDRGDRLLWRWARGAAGLADFGDPLQGTPYAICLYGGGAPGLLGEIVVSPGAGWRARGSSGYLYLDRDGVQAGVQMLSLKSSDADHGMILLKGRGAALPDLSLPLPADQLPLTIQLIPGAPAAVCWESRFAAPTRNDARGVTSRFP